ARSAASTGARYGASGTSVRGFPRDPRVSRSFANPPAASGPSADAGSVLWKRPSRDRGDAAAYGRISETEAPREPGRPFTARATQNVPAPASAAETADRMFIVRGRPGRGARRERAGLPGRPR